MLKILVTVTIKPQTITSVLETLLELLLLVGKTACSTFIPHLKEIAEKDEGLLQRVLHTMRLNERTADLDLSTHLKDLGLDLLTSSIIRQILYREYNVTKNKAQLGTLNLSDLLEIEKGNNRKLGTQD